ncbi:MAG: CBS domain-containing protein [Micromonosporaceae bacterium]
MAHRTVGEVMTSGVITVTARTRFKELARLMAKHDVSSLPVLDEDGRVVGVVCEVDLLRKEEYQEDPAAKRPPRWRRWPDRARARGRTARDVMTSPAVTVAPEATVVEAARLMDRHRIKHLVVAVTGGGLAGIVTPHDLLRVYLRPDDDIRAEIVGEVFVGYLGTSPRLVKVNVADGVVTLEGEVENKSMIPSAVRMTKAVDGVVDVVDKLTFAVDDTHRPAVADLTNY